MGCFQALLKVQALSWSCRQVGFGALGGNKSGLLLSLAPRSLQFALPLLHHA